ncbi:acyltransferase family protein [Litchfieldia salsa]|uniref:Fucose 4-O-acetylase n=1 Tax=Litchfieldia salsa TaxID=930152 RepID=A0A1H0T9K5_9BACI|nr:acyltransferase family protein [Litchfieldia salsa]SDP50717.1 Fucose 4-O-acetylase [Litchfieldia salsa]
MSGSLNRTAYFDNARFILIVLVVFGHLISPFRMEYHLLTTAYHFIYSFHMPAFILIAGFFSKGSFKEGYLMKVVQKILVPYIIFQLIYSIVYTIKDQEVTFTLVDPYWTLWFLLSLLFWNVLLKLFTKVKYPLFFAILIALLVGYVEGIGSYLSLSRTFVFFPIFLLGYYLNHKHFNYLITTKTRAISAISMVLLFLGYYFFFPESGRDLLLASSSYLEMGYEHQLHYAMLLRLLMYVVIFIITVCFLALIPKREYFFTHLGGRTLYVYLLHGLVIKLLQNTPLFDFSNELHAIFVFISTTLVISFLLASKPIISVTKPIIELHRYLKLNKRSKQQELVS